MSLWPKRSLFSTSSRWGMLWANIFLPALDLEIVRSLAAQGFNKTLRQLQVGNKGNSQVYCLTPDRVIIGELVLLGVLRQIDHQIDLPLAQVFCRIGTLRLERPMQHGGFDTVRLVKI